MVDVIFHAVHHNSNHPHLPVDLDGRDGLMMEMVQSIFTEKY